MWKEGGCCETKKDWLLGVDISQEFLQWHNIGKWRSHSSIYHNIHYQPLLSWVGPWGHHPLGLHMRKTRKVRYQTSSLPSQFNIILNFTIWISFLSCYIASVTYHVFPLTFLFFKSLLLSGINWIIWLDQGVTILLISIFFLQWFTSHVFTSWPDWKARGRKLFSFFLISTVYLPILVSGPLILPLRSFHHFCHFSSFPFSFTQWKLKQSETWGCRAITSLKPK